MTGDQITHLLQEAAGGDDEAFEQVASWAYGELERVAAARLRRQFGQRAASLTLEPAALVNETFLRLLRNPTGFANRRHFFAFATRVMERILVDYQRAREAQKRGGDHVRVTLSGLATDQNAPGVEAIAFLQVLNKLSKLDPRKAEVVRLRVLWGREMVEIAEILGASLATVERDWRFARAWLEEALRASQ